MAILPWQTNQWQQLWRSKQANRLPHALLFAGVAGIGKATFADNFSRALLCSQVDADGMCCNTCHSCRLIEGRVHTNVLWVEPEKEGQAIKIDQIRDVREFINQSSLQGTYRVVIINPANNMNANAVNALLKTLEEPSSGAIIILISDQSGRLPATILSRCQRIIFPRPKTEQALRWLNDHLVVREDKERGPNNFRKCHPERSEGSHKTGRSFVAKNAPQDDINRSLESSSHVPKVMDPALLLNLANGAPFAALRLVEDEILSVRQNLFQALYALSKYTLNKEQDGPIKSAATAKEADPLRILDFIISWLMDLLRMQLGDNGIVNRDYTKQLSELKQRTCIENNAKLMGYLQQLRGQICEGMNLNKQLMIESVLIRWMECT